METPRTPWAELTELVAVLAAGERPLDGVEVIASAACRLVPADAAVLTDRAGVVLARDHPGLPGLAGVRTPPLLDGLASASADLWSGAAAGVSDLRQVATPDADASAAVAAAGALGIAAVAYVPLPPDEEGEVTLTLYDAQPRAWTIDELAFAGFLGALGSACTSVASRLAQQRETVGQLQHALDSRVIIEQAKGVLVAGGGIDADDAFGLIRDDARRRSVTVKSVAEAVVHRGYRPGPPRTVRSPEPPGRRSSG